MLLLVFWGQALHIASATSMTIDEGLHIASGYTIWRTGDYRLVEEHPPLVKLWLALPLLPLGNLPDPTELPAWDDAADLGTESLPLLEMAQQLLYAYEPVDRWLFPARAMSTLLGILLLACIVRWSRAFAGRTGSLVALALASFDPNLLAHAAVAGTDLGATTFILLALWRAARFLKAPDRRTAIETGILLGLALASKLTAMLLGLALVLAGVVRLLTLPPGRRRRLISLAVVVLMMAAGVLWATYGLQVAPVPGLEIPLPAAAHSIPIRRLIEHSQGGHQAYLLGKNSMHGWWVYFPVAFLLKTPVPALIAGIWGLGAIWTGIWRARSGRRRWAAWLSPSSCFVLVYTGASLLSSLNIGYRHLLPLIPLLYIAIAAIARVGPRRRIPVARWAVMAILLSCQMVGTLTQTPHLLAFFNAAVGGSDEGWRYLADSNTDWGQAYKHLAAYQQANAIGEVRLSAFIFYDPATYGVDYTPLPPLGGDTPAVFPSRLAPPRGDYVISATPLDGIPTADEAMYDWFRWRAPDAKIGDALFHYHVTAASTEVAWVAQCVTPTAPLGTDAILAGFGTTPERQLAFDCTTTWIYPGEARDPGAYVLHGALVQDTLLSRLRYEPPVAKDGFVQSRLSETKITYWQRAYRTEPAFAVYRLEHPPELDGEMRPVDLAGPLALLGAETMRGGPDLEITTWWAVTASPTERPFSIMGHLLTQDGQLLGVGDGLGISPAALRAGDIVVQRHAFAATAEGEAATFQTGAYWLDSMERWDVLGQTGDAEAEPRDAILIPLDETP